MNRNRIEKYLCSEKIKIEKNRIRVRVSLLQKKIKNDLKTHLKFYFFSQATVNSEYKKINKYIPK